jgi:hypothetical protein
VQQQVGQEEISNQFVIENLLLTLLQAQRGMRDLAILAELPSIQDSPLHQVQKIWMNDTVQAEQLQASVLAHLAEDSDVGAVLDEVMSEYGSSMLLHDIGEFAEPGEVFNFWELQARALQREEIVIAHKCAANGNNWSLNPPNKDQVLNWVEGDQVLVLTRPST